MKITPFYRKSIVYLRFSHKGKWHIWATPYQVIPSLWNNDKKVVRASHPDAYEINRQLQEWAVAAYDLFIRKKMETSKELKQFIEEYGFEEKQEHILFIDFANKIKVTKTKLDQKNYNSMLLWLKKFDERITIDGWTSQRLDEFVEYLLDQPTIGSRNTVASYLKKIRIILNKAILYTLISYKQNPFKLEYKIKYEPTKYVKIDVDQLVILKNSLSELSSQGLKEAALSFLLAFAFDGLRVSDLFRIKKGMLKGAKLKLYTKKSTKYKELALTPFTKSLLDQLGIESLKDTDYIFPAIRRRAAKKPINDVTIGSVGAKINSNLKIIAEKLDLNPGLHMHAARNTLAFLADEMGVGLTSIQQALTHSSITETRKYIGKLQGDKFNEDRTRLHDKLGT